MSENTPGPWVVLEGWPLKVVRAEQQGRGLGASVDPVKDCDIFAHPIVSAEWAGYDKFSGWEEFTHRGYDREEALANARLIAAAPDLLEFARQALMHLSADYADVPRLRKADAAAMATRAEGVIAKATGR